MPKFASVRRSFTFNTARDAPETRATSLLQLKRTALPEIPAKWHLKAEYATSDLTTAEACGKLQFAEAFPVEIYHKIFHMTPSPTLLSLYATCKHFHTIMDQHFWEEAVRNRVRKMLSKATKNPAKKARKVKKNYHQVIVKSCSGGCEHCHAGKANFMPIFAKSLCRTCRTTLPQYQVIGATQAASRFGLSYQELRNLRNAYSNGKYRKYVLQDVMNLAEKMKPLLDARAAMGTAKADKARATQEALIAAQAAREESDRLAEMRGMERMNRVHVVQARKEARRAGVEERTAKKHDAMSEKRRVLLRVQFEKLGLKMPEKDDIVKSFIAGDMHDIVPGSKPTAKRVAIYVVQNRLKKNAAALGKTSTILQAEDDDDCEYEGKADDNDEVKGEGDDGGDDEEDAAAKREANRRKKLLQQFKMLGMKLPAADPTIQKFIKSFVRVEGKRLNAKQVALGAVQARLGRTSTLITGVGQEDMTKEEEMEDKEDEGDEAGDLMDMTEAVEGEVDQGALATLQRVPSLAKVPSFARSGSFRRQPVGLPSFTVVSLPSSSS